MTAQPRRIAVLGASGRMGRAVIEALRQHPDLRLGAAIEAPASAELGREAAPGISIGADLAACAGAFDVAVDFTRPEATLATAAVCASLGKAMVIGTTGLSPEQRAAIADVARRIPVCMAGNFSIGVNLCLALLEHAARALGPAFDIEVIEAHHRHKVDAPSGTALMMGEACARGAGRKLEDCAVYERHGAGARPEGAIGFSTVRGGDVVGDHAVLFLGDGERVEISHRATSRANFAHGALRAATWVAGRPAGLYSMRDVLG